MSLLQPMPESRPTPHQPRPHRRKPRHLWAVETSAPSLAPPATREPEDEIPAPPEAAVQSLALYVFEAVEGFRPISGLGRLVSPAVADDLGEQRRARIEQRTLLGDKRRIVPTPGPAHLSRPQPMVIESVVVLRAVPRSIAVAMRFEFAIDRWQAAQVAVL